MSPRCFFLAFLLASGTMLSAPASASAFRRVAGPTEHRGAGQMAPRRISTWSRRRLRPRLAGVKLSPLSALAQRPTRAQGSPALATRRQALNASGIHVAIPVLIIDIIPLLGNLVALPTELGRVTWGIVGLTFGALGSLIAIPALFLPYVGMGLLVLQSVLTILGGINLLLGRLYKRNDATPFIQPGSQRIAQTTPRFAPEEDAQASLAWTRISRTNVLSLAF